MCRIADDHDPACMPAIERDPLNCADVQRITGIQAVQVRRYEPIEVGEVLAKTIKQGPAPGPGYDPTPARRSLRATVSHRHKSKKLPSELSRGTVRPSSRTDRRVEGTFLASRSFQRVEQRAAGRLHAFCRRPRAPYSDVRFPADEPWGCE